MEKSSLSGFYSNPKAPVMQESLHGNPYVQMSRKETYSPNCKINQVTHINSKEVCMGNKNFKSFIKPLTKHIYISKFIIWAIMVTSTAMASSGYFLKRDLGKAYLLNIVRMTSYT